MNDLPISNDPAHNSNPPPDRSASGASMASRPDAAHGGKRNNTHGSLRPVYGALGVLTVLLLAQWGYSQHELSSLRQEMAQRLRAGDTVNTETKVLVKSLQDSTKELQAKINVIENKQVEAQSQQLALEQLYQEMSRNRDDWALAEIEQVLSTASQQLQLAGNVQGALIALQNADTRLSRSDKPQFILIRRAIAKDIDRLKALPAVDVTGIALRLDSVIGQIDSMPLLSGEKPAVAASQPKNSRRAPKASNGKAPAGKSDAATNSAESTDWLATLSDKWQSLSNELWTEIRQLIRVREVDNPDALLLSPSQTYFARENLKLRLLNARLALLTRNESAFRNDLIAAQDIIAKYFDTRARQTQTTQTLLRQVQSSNLAIEMPTLVDSLNAVRNYKAKP